MVWRQRIALIGVVAAFGAAGFSALGFWQLERLAWKNMLIAAVETRTTAEPIELNAHNIWDSFDPIADEYRRVAVTGRFDHDAETLVQAVTAYGGGFWVVTPLLLENGRSVLINRGFVLPEQRDPETRPALTGEVTITGLLRQSEPGGGFLRSNDPAADRWYSRDVQAIAADKGIAEAAPFFVDAAATPPGVYPIGGLTVLSFSNNHLGYALTWFALALMLVGGFGYLLWDARRTR